MKISAIAAALALGMLVSAPVYAQTATPTPAATPKVDAAARAAKSADCSKQADAKNLHGKARKKFREECKKGM
jgi:hypothetical protein